MRLDHKIKADKQTKAIERELTKNILFLKPIHFECGHEHTRMPKEKSEYNCGSQFFSSDTFKSQELNLGPRPIY